MDDVHVPLPEELQIEVTASCNLRCRMCLVRYRPPVNRVAGSMRIEDFDRLLDDLPQLKRVTVQGLGEPLLAPDFFAIVESARRRHLEVGFNTNGTLLTRRRCERLVELGVSWIHISVDGASAETFEFIRSGASYARVMKNLSTLLEVKQQAGVDEPRVQMNVVLMRRNLTELPEIVRCAARVGVERCWVQNLAHDFTDTSDEGPYLAIKRFTDRERVDPGDQALHDSLTSAVEVARDAGMQLRLPAAGHTHRAHGEPACDWPWRNAYVTHDLRVQPCCMVMGVDRAMVGDLREHAFAEIWRGEPYVELRRALQSENAPDICRGCSVYKRLF